MDSELKRLLRQIQQKASNTGTPTAETFVPAENSLEAISDAIGIVANGAGTGFEPDSGPSIYDRIVGDTDSILNRIGDITTRTNDGNVVAALGLDNLPDVASGDLYTLLWRYLVNTAIAAPTTKTGLQYIQAIGSNDANNDFDSTNVVSNRDGSLLERLEFILASLGAIYSTTTALGTTNTFIDSTRTEVDDYFNGRVYFVQITGNNAGLAARVVNWDLASTTGDLEPIMPNAVGSGISYMLIAMPTAWELGDNSANNAFDSTNVVANENGSVLERLEQIQEEVNIGTGTSIAANNSLVDAIGSTGAALIDSATSVVGILGVNDADNTFDSTNIVSNRDGSLLERTEDIITTLEVPAGDAVSNVDMRDVIGNKSDAAAVTVGTASILARLRAIEAALSVNAVAGGEFELDGIPDLWDSLVVDSSSQADIISLTGNRDGAIIERLSAIINALNIVNAGAGGGFEEDGAPNLVTALGTNGVTITDSATSVIGVIGANNADNAFDSTNIVANENGSVLERLEHMMTTLSNKEPRVQEIVIYPVAEDAGTTELSDDGTSPTYFPVAAASTAVVGEGNGVAAWTEDIPFEAEGTITIIAIYAEFEWQTRFLVGAGNGTNTESKIQISGDGGGSWVDLTDTYTHSTAAMTNRIRAGVGRWVSTITAGSNQLQFRLLHWVDVGTGVSTSEAQIRSNSYVRITYIKS